MGMQTTAIQELQRQKMLLQMEYYTEKEAFRKQTEAMGLLRKVKRGDAWFPLSVGRSYYNSMNQMALEVRRTADQDIEHNFEFGRPSDILHATKGEWRDQRTIALFQLFVCGVVCRWR